MEVNSTAANAAQATGGSGARKALIASDFETFLKMMTTQMQNQDPLNPIDSSDYAVQLATFSGVEQQLKTNQLLQGLAGQMGVMSMAQLAGWVGMEARAAAPVLFDGSPVSLATSPASLADRAVLVVRDTAGTVVARHDVSAQAEQLSWTGLDDSGKALPNGIYRLSLESYSGADLLETSDVESYARIIEARASATGTLLILEGGVQISSEAVTALRES